MTDVIYRGAVKNLSTAKIPWWIDREAIENLLAGQKVSWWIEEAIEHLSRRIPESSMDRDFDKICQDKRKKGLIKDNLSRICQGSYQEKHTHTQQV